jgi:hypothetical protein
LEFAWIQEVVGVRATVPTPAGDVFSNDHAFFRGKGMGAMESASKKRGFTLETSAA